MLRTLLCVSLASCAVTAPDPMDSFDPPAPPAEGPTGVFARLHDETGGLLGLAGVEREHRSDAARCGGVASDVRITGTVAEIDRPLAEVLQLAFPAQLDFSDKANREASLRRFKVFVENMLATSKRAREHYVARLDAAADTATKLAATARLVQVHRQLASLIARAEIPVDVRTGELAPDKIDAFCEKMAEVAAPFLVQADEAVRVCLGMSTGTTGWWTTVCAP